MGDVEKNANVASTMIRHWLAERAEIVWCEGKRSLFAQTIRTREELLLRWQNKTMDKREDSNRSAMGRGLQTPKDDDCEFKEMATVVEYIVPAW